MPTSSDQPGIGINRSMLPGTIIPELVYPDLAAAVVWLCATSGFRERLRIGTHRSQLVFGDAAVIAVAQPAGHAPDQSLHVEQTHSLMVRIEDLDRHYAHVAQCGARIISPPTDFPYGERQYTAEDLAGRRWTFSQSIADTTAQIIANYRTKAATVWPGLRAFCEYALLQRHPMVLDGYQLEPRFIHELIVAYPQLPIAAVVLTRTQVERIRDDLISTTDPDDWVGQSTTQAITFTRIAEMVSQYSQYFSAEAARYQLASFDMDVSFHTQIAQAMAYHQRSPM